MRRFLLLLIAGILPLVIVQEGSAQYRGGRGGGRGGFSFDPNMIFDRYAQGKPAISINDIPADRREPMLQFARDNKITNGQLTREQFAVYLGQRMKSMGGRFGGPPGGGPPGGGRFGGKSSSGSGGDAGAPPGASPGTPPTAEAVGQWADSDFKRRDNNGDGKLNLDEMPDALKTDLGRWDKNRDKLIDATEYKEYFIARIQGGNGGGSGGAATPMAEADTDAVIARIIIEEADLDLRPTVYRAGKLPKELPSWFKEMDTDEDGQIAFHEWRKGGKSLDDFATWDRNDDGFITIDEAMRHLNLASTSTATTATTIVRPSYSSESRNGPGGESRGRGKGGFRRRGP